MTSPQPGPTTPLSQSARQQLDEVRRGLLRVHKTLLEDARIRYEREQGRIEGSGALLRLVLNDPWFAWLHPLSGLVVQIDELLAADEPTSADGEALLNQARSLMRPDENGEGFARRYTGRFRMCRTCSSRTSRWGSTSCDTLASRRPVGFVRPHRSVISPRSGRSTQRMA